MRLAEIGSPGSLGGGVNETTKGLRLGPGETLDPTDVAARGWNALRGDLELPALLLHQSRLHDNVVTMSRYCDHHGVLLAPHAKTSMSPEITRLQLAAGAWAVTGATAAQVRTLRAFGVPRILLANVLVDRAAIRWIVESLLCDDETDFMCYIDSIAGLEHLERTFAERAPLQPLKVLVEVGYAGGRTGVRSLASAIRLAERASESPWLSVVGVAGFEGLIPSREGETDLEGIRRLLLQIKVVTQTLHGDGLFDIATPVVSAGGSSYFDHVVEQLAPASFDFDVQTVLRSGCYATHDHGVYQATSPLAERGRVPFSSRLRPALELVASVWSRPEPGLVIAGFGRRDVPTDQGLPVALRNHSRVDANGDISDFAVIGVNDQHAFLRVPEDSDVAVGDILGFGISHPCGAFDRWRFIPVVSEEYDVVSGVTTYF